MNNLMKRKQILVQKLKEDTKTEVQNKSNNGLYILMVYVAIIFLFLTASCKTCKCPAYSQNSDLYPVESAKLDTKIVNPDLFNNFQTL